MTEPKRIGSFLRWMFGLILGSGLLTVGVVSCGISHRTAVVRTSTPITMQAQITADNTGDLRPTAIQFVSPANGFMLEPSGFAGGNPGTGGKLLETQNGGQTWQAQNLPGGLYYMALHFFSPTSGVLLADSGSCFQGTSGCAAEVLTTSDKGAHWTSVLSLAGQNWDLLYGFGKSHAWAETSTANCNNACSPVQSLYGTSNGGRDWTLLDHTAVPQFASLWTTDGASGFGVAGSAFYSTHDGGHSWTKESSFPFSFSYPNAGSLSNLTAGGGNIAVPAPGVIYVSMVNAPYCANGGCPAFLFKSVNGGKTFSQVWSDDGTFGIHVQMATATSGALMLTGWSENQSQDPGTDLVLSTQDGFLHTRVAQRLPLDISALAFLNGQDGWVAGSPVVSGMPANGPMRVMATQDGGLSWHLVSASLNPLFPSGTFVRVPGGPWYGVGTPQDPGAFLTSSDGQHWQKIGELPPSTGSCPGAWGSTMLQFFNANLGYVDRSGDLFRTTNGGRSFSLVKTPRPGSLVGMSFLTAHQGYMLTAACRPGEAVSLFATQDQGYRWTHISNLPSYWIGKIAFLTPAHGYALVFHRPTHPGLDASLWQTENGGRSWTPSGISVPKNSQWLYQAEPGVIAVDSPTRIVLLRAHQAPIQMNLAWGNRVGPTNNGPNAVLNGQVLTLLVPGGIRQGRLAPHMDLAPIGSGT